MKDNNWYITCENGSYLIWEKDEGAANGSTFICIAANQIMATGICRIRNEKSQDLEEAKKAMSTISEALGMQGKPIQDILREIYRLRDLDRSIRESLGKKEDMAPKETEARKTLETVRVDFKEWKNCRLEISSYKINNQMSIVLVGDHSHDVGPVAVATRCVPGYDLPKNQVIIKDYDENKGMLDALIKAGVISSRSIEIREGLFRCELLIPVK